MFTVVSRCSRFATRGPFLLGLVITVMIHGALRSEQPDVDAQVEALVKELGAEEFRVRVAASKRLWELGHGALPALRAAARSDDPEVRGRARKIAADLELGIYIDTPPETAAMIRKFHAGTLKEKEEMLSKLGGADQVETRINLLLAEKNPDWRRKLIQEHAGSGDVILDALRKSGRLAEADALLATLSPRSWATHLFFEGRTGGARERLAAEWNNGKGSADPAQLFWILIVSDELEEARAVAEQSADPELRREACLRQGDWVGFLKAAGEETGKNPLEKLAFKASFLAKAGKEAEAQAVIDELAALEMKDDYMARNRAMSLIILGRFETAQQDFERRDEIDRYEFSFLQERFQFEKLFQRFDAEPSAKGIRTVMEQRVKDCLEEAAGNDGRSTRRELFYLARSVGEFLVSVGEKEEARKVILAAVELVRDEGSYLYSLASSCRRMGLLEEADSIGLMSLELGNASSFLSMRFPYDRPLAEFWWEYLRDKHPAEPLPETIRRVEGRLKQENPETRNPIEQDVLEWLERHDEETRAKYYGALAVHYRKAGQRDTAADYYRKQSALSSKPAAPLIEAGSMFAEGAQWDTAAGLYAEAAEKEPGAELAVYLHGHALVKGGDREVGEALKAAARAMPLANSSRRNSFAYALSRNGLPEAALEQWRLLVKTAAHDGWDGSAFWALRTARLRLAPGIAAENPARAADYQDGYLMSFHKTNTSSTSRSYLIYRSRIERYRFEARLAEGEIDAALQHVHRALAAWPGSTNLAIKACDELDRAGREADGRAIYESLAECYARNLTFFPNSARDHNSLAWLAGRSGRDLELALRHAERAVELVPDHAEYLDTLAEVTYRLGDPDKAITLAKRCVELEPDDEQYREQLARFKAGK